MDEEQTIANLTKIKDKVTWILYKFPSARSNDKILIIKYLQYYEHRLIYDVKTQTLQLTKPLTYDEFMEITSFESITRCRRKIQEQAREAVKNGYATSFDAEMLPSGKVATQRAIMDTTFRQYFWKGN